MVRVAAMAAASTLLTLCAACGDPTGGAAGPGEHALPSPHGYARVQATLQEEVTVPAGYGPINNLVGDHSGAGAWFWDASADEDTIFHVTAGRLTAWPAVAGAAFVPARARGALAAGPNGAIWLAVNDALVRLDPRTGATDSWSIPAGRPNRPAADHLPPGLVDQGAADALAVSRTGTVAIASTGESSVAKFRPADQSFSQVLLPSPSDLPRGCPERRRS